MSLVRIPFYSKAESSEPLRRCVTSTATEMGMSEYTVLLLVNDFLDQLAYQVSIGRTVRLPGFGIFAPKFFASSQTCAPRFSASRGFRLQTRHSAPPHTDGGNDLKRHAKRASDPTRGITQRVFTSRSAILRNIRKQGVED